jgi:hypothetical protein
MPDPHSGQKRRWIALPLLPSSLKVFTMPVNFSAAAGTPATVAKAEGAAEFLAVSAVTHPDEGGFCVRAVDWSPASPLIHKIRDLESWCVRWLT